MHGVEGQRVGGKVTVLLTLGYLALQIYPAALPAFTT